MTIRQFGEHTKRDYIRQVREFTASAEFYRKRELQVEDVIRRLNPALPPTRRCRCRGVENLHRMILPDVGAGPLPPALTGLDHGASPLLRGRGGGRWWGWPLHATVRHERRQRDLPLHPGHPSS